MSQRPRQRIAGEQLAAAPDVNDTPQFICGPPLKQGVLYSLNQGGTKLVAAAIAKDQTAVVGPQVSPEQILPLPVQAAPDAHHLVNLPDGLVIAEVRRLSQMASHIGAVGFWNQGGIHYRFLEPPQESDLSALMGSMSGQSKVMHISDAAAFQQRLDKINDHMRAYAGWLMSDLGFHFEHSQLCAEFHEEFTLHGFPPRRPITRGDSSASTEFYQRCREHYERWVLDGIAGPGMPTPVAPQFPNLLQAVAGSGVLNHTIPAYFPISGQSWFLEMLDDTRPTSRTMPHLAGWFNMTRKEDAQGNKLSGYRRRLLLLVYWRGLLTAFPCGLQRGKKKLTSVFAEFFGLSDDTIKSDLTLLKGVLEPLWNTAAT